MKLVLHDNVLTERGVTRAVADYARHLRSHYGIQVWIAYNKMLEHKANPSVVQSLAREFDLLPYRDRDDLESIVSTGVKADRFYAMKSGARDGVYVRSVPNAIHAVFQEYEPHGDSYAYISSWLARAMRWNVKQRLRFEVLHRRNIVDSIPANARSFSHVPYIVDIPPPQSDYRKRLRIPDSAFVIGSLSAADQFDLAFVRDWLVAYIQRNPDAYFIGPNLLPFADHPRMLFPSTITDAQEKSDYLGSLDIFLHARSMGETFGLAICEALASGVPAISYRGGRDRNHIDLLRNSGWLYSSPAQLDHCVDQVRKSNDSFSDKARQIVAPFAPEAVISTFRDTFLR